MARPAAEAVIVWEGPDEFRPFLVPIADLEPFPGNPRVGNRDVVVASLRRFGQKKLSVVRDGNRIVAGHHVVLGATELGWTHVAAPPVLFENEDEQRAFLLADNRSSDVGTYDLELLQAQLAALAASSTLEGTGYDADYLDELTRDLETLQAPPAEPPDDFPLLDPELLPTAYRCPSCSYEWSGNPAPGAETPAE